MSPERGEKIVEKKLEGKKNDTIEMISSIPLD